MRIIKYFKFLFFLGIITGLIYLFSCSEGTNPNNLDFVLPDSNLSFDDDISPLFTARCGTGSNCHSPFNEKIHPLNHELRYFSEIINYNLYVTGEQLVNLELDPRNPSSSILYLILSEGYSYVDRMPLEEKPLNKNQLDGILTWIGEGVKP